MAVPAHDQRDYEFAKKFELPIIQVIAPSTSDATINPDCAYTDTNSGILINSGFLNGLSVSDAKEKMIKWLEENKVGCKK